MFSISKATRNRVAAAAGHRCGYCLTPQAISGAQMHVDHIVPLACGGSSGEENLWLACAWCNSYKGRQTEAVDPGTGAKASLFNPRTEKWAEHFRWSDDGSEIIGMTAPGRATVEALRLNNPFIVPARRQWALAGWHPPQEL